MTAEQMARVLVSSYPDDRAGCVEALRKHFPDANVQRAVDEARAWKDNLDESLADED